MIKEVINMKELEDIPDSFEGEIKIIGYLPQIKLNHPKAFLRIGDRAVIDEICEGSRIDLIEEDCLIHKIKSGSRVISIIGGLISCIESDALVENITKDARICRIINGAKIDYIGGRAIIDHLEGNIHKYKIVAAAQIKNKHILWNKNNCQ